MKISFHCTLAPIITLEKSAVSWTLASIKVMSSSFPAPTVAYHHIPIPAIGNTMRKYIPLPIVTVLYFLLIIMLFFL